MGVETSETDGRLAGVGVGGLIACEETKTNPKPHQYGTTTNAADESRTDEEKRETLYF